MSFQTLSIGGIAPDFCLTDQHENLWRLSDHKGKKIILYFYPKDMTPGCTTQACDFKEQKSTFNSLNALIVGVSKDSHKSHLKFDEKYDLGFTLLSDETQEVCKTYGVWAEKRNYAKTYFGIERTTFFIDEHGVLKAIYPKVRVKGHIQQLIQALTNTEELSASL
ncbi:MAG TPA: thioredoxin-dependent thiol peroxidase [Alphaproteobacteria bacterium]|nr:thioredoxin-dependent thiol peroxidase [Alphaproteobacteria bacterium]